MTTKEQLSIILPQEELEELTSTIPSNKIPLWYFWEEFVDISLGFGKSMDTLKGVQSSMRMILRHSNLNTIESWQDTPEVSRELLRLKNKKSWSNVTTNSHRKFMNTYFIFLKRLGYIEENPIMRIPKMSEPMKNMPTFTRDDIRKLMGHLMLRKNHSALEKLRNILFFQIAILTGARPKELLGLRFSSITQDRKQIRINGAKQKGKERYYELDSTTKELLSNYIKEVNGAGRLQELDSHLFLSMKNKGKPWTQSGIIKLCQRLSAEIGMQVTAYMCRRYACTELFANDVPIQNIQLFMGHNRLATTYRYNYNSSRNTKVCTDILNNFG